MKIKPLNTFNWKNHIPNENTWITLIKWRVDGADVYTFFCHVDSYTFDNAEWRYSLKKEVPLEKRISFPNIKFYNED